MPLGKEGKKDTASKKEGYKERYEINERYGENNKKEKKGGGGRSETNEEEEKQIQLNNIFSTDQSRLRRNSLRRLVRT